MMVAENVTKPYVELVVSSLASVHKSAFTSVMVSVSGASGRKLSLARTLIFVVGDPSSISNISLFAAGFWFTENRD